MPFTAFTYLQESNQLRQDNAAGHAVDPLDGFAASIISSDPPTANAPNTYPLTDGVTLDVSVDGAAATTITFNTGSFVDITEATPAEVAAVIDAALTGATAAVAGNFVQVTTTAVGPAASLQVTGGDANDALQFPTTLASGSLGFGTLVLGHAAPGKVERFVPGDLVDVSQSITLDETLLLLTGEARIPTLPAGVAWRLSMRTTSGEERAVVFDTAGTFTLNEFGFSAAQQPGATTLTIRLEVQGVAATGTDVELPAFYIDLIRSVNATDVQVLNRVPAPLDVEVGATPDLSFQLDLASAVNGTAVDQTATDIFVNGSLAYDGATDTFQTGWTGAGSSATFGTIYSTGATDARIVFQSTGLSFTSEQVITVRVVSEHVGGAGAIDQTYTFTTADTVDLEVDSAQARDKLTVRVEFNDDVDQTLATTAGNYVFETLTVPAVTVVAQSATLVGTDAVDVVVDLEWSQGADYRVTVLNVTDTSGNPLATGSETADFAGFLPDIPAGRNFQVLDLFSADNKRRDETGDLRSWLLIVQDVVDLLLCSIDRWTEIFDVDVAPESFVDAILCDLGNPFDFIDLSDVDKRRLARTLLDIYKTKGTEEGLINAVRFLTGIDVTLDIINASTDFWELGVSLLGDNTFLAPPVGSPLWYSFWVDTVTVLTAEQLDRILKIATYMKAAHEHVLGVRDPTTTFPAPVVYWTLGVAGQSELNDTTLLGD